MNTPSSIGCPLTVGGVLDDYFMEHRAKLLDLAAFLDRVDRAEGDPSGDFRYESLRDALHVLSDGEGNRTARILDVFSDPTVEPLESAAGLKGAHGAWPAYAKEA